MIEVAGPDGVIHEFPDNTAPAVIKGAMQKVYVRTAPEKSKETGALDAFVRSAANAATFGFADRIAATLGGLTGVGGEMGSYEKNLAQQRAITKANEEEHPIASIGGAVAGGAVLPAKAIAAASGLAAKIGAGARVGALQGGLYGVGSSPDLTNPPEVATNAGFGVGTGALVGGAIPIAGAAAKNVLNASGIPQTIRSVISPENEASRLIGQALESDAATRANILARRRIQGETVLPAEAARMGLTPNEVGTALDNSVPAAVADYGGEATRRLARAAANISPEASDILRSETAHRFAGQNTRIADRLAELGGGNSVATLDKLKEAAQKVYKPLYSKAFAEGDRGIWTPELERLTGSPDFVSAMKSAVATSKSRAINEGHPYTSPGVDVSETGLISFKPGKNGKLAYPNLQYWDSVKKDLDAASQAAYKAGRTEEGSRLAGQARLLRNELDKEVPSYAAPREAYAKFGGAKDALEAGKEFVTAKGQNEEFRKDIARMSDPEKKLFAHGFMAKLESDIRETGANRSPLIKEIFQSQAARERLNMAVGAKTAGKLEHALHVENILDQLRTAVTGNSTTAQQIGDMMRHGGLLGGGLHLAGVVKAMMQHGAKGVNESVMQRVAEGLTSRDPAVYQRALETVRKIPPLSKMFQNATASTIKAALAAFYSQGDQKQ